MAQSLESRLCAGGVDESATLRRRDWIAIL
jgi:hypothetical protein